MLADHIVCICNILRQTSLKTSSVFSIVCHLSLSLPILLQGYISHWFNDGSVSALFLPTSLCTAFTLFQLAAVGLASFFAAALLSALAFTYCHHLNRPSAESAVIHPSTPNHLTYNKQGNATPKNEKYIPMEFKVGSHITLNTFLNGL